ncbi:MULTISPECIES: helix-turn-helix domain-containing protein [unclassified Micromonospora]|uniref:helix-turn-helix domain-containing protein n=1 Tax=unclassified Micromonospora TaxID=2617518 RepID=UPI003A8A4399
MTPRRRISGIDRYSCRNEFAQLYRAGYSIRRIARETHRSYGFVHRILNEANVTFRTRGHDRRPHTQTADHIPETTNP